MADAFRSAREHKRALPAPPLPPAAESQPSNHHEEYPGESPERPLSPAIQKLTVQEVLALPLPPPPSITNRTVMEELGFPTPSPPAVVNRANREDPPPASKVEAPSGERRSKVVLGILRRSKREALLKRAELGFRICGLIFCLISFSVMAADKTQGWAGDSFERYKEYRYCISVTVIGFMYSGFQAYALVHHLVTGKDLIPHPFRQYLDFSLDQILAYLLISASSSAATRTDDWVSNWGEDEFTKMASASIGMSFMAFVSFALSSLLSGYNLCTSTV
ncbi:hypothetical protein H6P81_009950 [Aristolochia fimbriata]|uniref:CASP-like protein n=1 Tax=Aristolochia fimbriata TaxID=158543 RepID=A0AAV7EMC6_ARIFI|nr:hypothetical protein H6P81_009950 [Aristolochia fimbriata]